MRYILGKHIRNMFICANIMELYGSSLHHIKNEVISDPYVLQIIMVHIIFIQIWLSQRITVDSISRSNRSINDIGNHMASPLVKNDAIYSTSITLREIIYCFLLHNEIMANPRLKQHPEVLFLLETLPSKFESV
jgi:hypothetical protein